MLRGAIDALLQVDRRLQVTAPPLVEINHRAARDGRFEWVSLYNHTGARGSAIHAPTPVRGIEVQLRTSKSVNAVRSLATGKDLEAEQRDGVVSVKLGQLDHYDIVVFQ